MKTFNYLITKISQLAKIAEEPCSCLICKNVTCRSCYARQEMGGLEDWLDETLETIHRDFTLV
jgi:hypothetical protein